MSIYRLTRVLQGPVFTLLLLLHPLAALAAEEIYRSSDGAGNPVFTDRPEGDARRIELPAPNLDSSGVPTSGFSASPSTAIQTEEYASVRIASPAAEATLRNNSGDFEVRVEIKPELQAQHWLLLKMDGEAVSEPQKSAGFQLTNIDRGSHQLVVEVVDQDQKSIIQSAPVTIHLHRHSRFFPAPPSVTPQHPARN